eukprot:7684838-Pyramimonas_sp.AAC.1
MRHMHCHCVLNLPSGVPRQPPGYAPAQDAHCLHGYQPRNARDCNSKRKIDMYVCVSPSVELIKARA